MTPKPLLSALLLACVTLPALPTLAAPEKETRTFLSVPPGQSFRLGIQTQRLGKENTLQSPGLPARVIVPNEQLHLVSAPLPGIIQNLHVAPGMTVRKGQPLVQLNSREAAELQRDIQQSKAQTELSRKNWQRDQTLFKEGLIPEARLQTSYALWQQAEAAAEEHRQTRRMIGRIDPAGMTLTAPIDGIVLEQNATIGQKVDTATPLYTLARPGALWLEIQTPAELATQLTPGQNVRTGDVSGKIITIGATVQPATQSVSVRARLEPAGKNAHLPLRPGQSVEASIELPGRTGTRIPAGALVHHKGHTVVFVTAQGGYRIQEVKKLKENRDGLLVSGLRPEETIVVQGASSLKALWTGTGAE